MRERQRGARFWLIAAGVFVPATVALPAAGQLPAERGGAASRAPFPDSSPVLGYADYRWTVRPLDGEPVALEAFRGRVLFINLWASWCAPCVRELETFERLRHRLADTGVEFLLVAAEGEAPVRRFLRRYRYDLPFYLEEERIPPAFGMRGLPTSWVVDRGGRIALLRHGEAVWDTDRVEAFLRSLVER